MRLSDKCDGTPIPDNVEHQVVTFNPQVHQYGTLNLPTWKQVDYPVSNKNWPLKNTDADMKGCQLRNLWDYQYQTDTETWKRYRAGEDGQDTALEHYRSDSYSKGDLFYGQNLFHWNSPERGATRLYTDSTSSNLFGAQFGSVRDLHPDHHPNTQGGIPSARWMKGVSGLQFEWDMGIDDEDSYSDTNENSYGYRLWELNLVVTFMYPFGIDEWAEANGVTDFNHTYTSGSHEGHHMVPALTAYVPLFHEGKLHKDCCYWYERFSLWDPEPLAFNSNVADQNFFEQQGQNEQPPLRSGRCGFAVNSNHPMYNLLTHGMYIGTDDDGKEHTQIFHHPVSGKQIPTAGPPLFTGFTIGFKTFSDHSNKRKNFRLWSVKPMTQPLTYTLEKCEQATSGQLRCETLEYTAENDTFKPYSMRDQPRVGFNNEPFGHELLKKHGIGGKISNRSEMVLPAIVNPKEGSPHHQRMYVYDSAKRQQFAPDAGTETSAYQPLVLPDNFTGADISGGKGSGSVGDSGGLP